MAAVLVGKPGKADVYVDTAPKFVDYIYRQGYLPLAGTVSEAWQTLAADLPPGTSSPEWPSLPTDPDDAARLMFRQAVIDAVEAEDVVTPEGQWNFILPPTGVGSGDGTGSSIDPRPLIQQHIDDETPHPAYDEDIPSLVVLFENGLI